MDRAVGSRFSLGALLMSLLVLGGFLGLVLGESGLAGAVGGRRYAVSGKLRHRHPERSEGSGGRRRRMAAGMGSRL